MSRKLKNKLESSGSSEVRVRNQAQAVTEAINAILAALRPNQQNTNG
ncbi:hypothetical protein [Ammoniphilus sp. YIM 78166]|nr:hypothetical protein [Ammoniphilus sp. YIM 78166]